MSLATGCFSEEERVTRPPSVIGPRAQSETRSAGRKLGQRSEGVQGKWHCSELLVIIGHLQIVMTYNWWCQFLQAYHSTPGLIYKYWDVADYPYNWWDKQQLCWCIYGFSIHIMRKCVLEELHIRNLQIHLWLSLPPVSCKAPLQPPHHNYRYVSAAHTLTLVCHIYNSMTQSTPSRMVGWMSFLSS